MVQFFSTGGKYRRSNPLRQLSTKLGPIKSEDYQQTILFGGEAW